MSKFIATQAIKGAHETVAKAETMLKEALDKLGPDVPIEFKDSRGGPTAFHVPLIYGYTGMVIEKLGDLQKPLDLAKSLLPPEPSQNLWLPYLGETLDSGVATLYAEEIIKSVEFANGTQPEVKGDFTYNGPIDDSQMRGWGIQLVDGRMPGFAAILGCAKNNEVAVKIVRECQSKGLLVFLAGNNNGRSVVDQLREEGVEMGYDTFIVPFGSDTESIVYALGFATRAALSFGGVEAGDYRRILLYNKFRCFAFALVLGDMAPVDWATGAGAITFGFPAICDTQVPNILPTGVTRYEHVVSMPFDDIPGADDMERAEKLVEKCIEVRGIKVKIAKVPIPNSFGPAFEGEVVRRANLYAEYGSKAGPAVELLEMKDINDVEDGKFEVIGPDLDDLKEGDKTNFALKIDVAGRKMQKDFEPVLERQIHHFVNGAEGVQHQGQRDITWIRISKGAYEKGFRLKHLGDILHANLHNQFGAIVDKVQVTVITDPAKVADFMEHARGIYAERDQRLAGITDDSVDTFYSCALCQSFAPTHICVINPERTGLCGAYSWLDCRAAYEINPTGPNQPVAKGKLISQESGEWEGVNQFVFENSQRVIERFTLYSVMDAPCTTCGCCEAIMMIIPEANGFMVVSRDDYSETPCGLKFTTAMSDVGGGAQNPGMMGMGKRYVLSDKFISAEGGLKRLVWLSKNIKEEFAEELKEAAKAAGDPDLIDKIADGTTATTSDELLAFLEEKGHPALTMDPII
ncbi:acetyl-CoA decarbonylase/synthase complex subunit alpha/beta [Chloroflexota bacterium]